MEPSRLPPCWRPSVRLIIALVFSLVCAVTTPVHADSSGNVLRLYNWEDYMPQAVLDAFKAKTGYEVEVVYYESDELKDEMLQTTGGAGLDLIIGSAASFQAYIQQGGMFAALPESLPNLKHVDQRWYQLHEGLGSFAVPYLWGTLGIAYLKDKVTQPVTRWTDLLNPEPALHGKVQMIEDMRDLFTPALKSLGSSVNETDPKAILKAGELLLAQKPHVASYQYLDITDRSELLRETAWMALAYNGDAIALNEKSDNIAFVVPEEGTNIWVDCIAVLSASKNKSMAWAFIDFINEPAIAASIASELYYASPNAEARKLTAPEMLANPLIYPPQAVLDKSEAVKPLQGRAAVYYNAQYSKLIQ